MQKQSHFQVVTAFRAAVSCDQMGCGQRYAVAPFLRSDISPFRRALQNAKINSVEVWLHSAYVISQSIRGWTVSLMLKHRKKPPEADTTKLDSFCSFHAAKSHRHRCAQPPRKATDEPIQPLPGELETVRTMLPDIE